LIVDFVHQSLYGSAAKSIAEESDWSRPEREVIVGLHIESQETELQRIGQATNGNRKNECGKFT
jgi:hypothetical protein